MFNKLLIKALGKRFNKLSPEEKQNVRGMVNNETISDTTEKQKVKKRRNKTMADEKEVENKVETENNEVEKEKSTDVVEKDGEVEKKEEKTEETTETTDDTAEDEEPTVPQVEDTEPQGNGIPIEELVTKDMLAQRLAAFEAKFNAVVKENQDLKEQLSSKSEELDGMKDKYENKDFGNFQKQGMQVKDKQANSSFDEYSKQFM